MNSAALAASNITATTEDPPGGHIRRVEGSMEPNGVLEEAATGLVVGGFAGFGGGGDIDAMLRRTIELYASYGTTTIQNGGGTGPETMEAIRAAAEREPLDADVALFTSVDAILDGTLEYEGTYRNGFRVAGVKFVLDGSPQGRTAWVTEPYDEGPPGAPSDYRAYGTMDPDLYKAGAASLVERGVPFLAHANGDAAMDLMLDGVEEAVAEMDEAPDHRSVIIHAQLMRADQLDRAARLGVVPSFFSAHTFFWGDWHVRSFGEERGTNVSPVRWANRSWRQLHDTQRRAGGPAAHHAVGVDHREPEGPQWTCAWTAPAGDGPGGVARRHPRGGVPVLRGRHQGLDHGWETGRSGDPGREPGDGGSGRARAHPDSGDVLEGQIGLHEVSRRSTTEDPS